MNTRTPILNNICERLLLVVTASFSIQLFSRITFTDCFFLFNEQFPFNFSNSSQFPWLTLNSKYSEIASFHIKLGRRKQIQFNQPKSKHLLKVHSCRFENFSNYIQIHIKIIPLIKRLLELFTRKVCIFLKT